MYVTVWCCNTILTLSCFFLFSCNITFHPIQQNTIMFWIASGVRSPLRCENTSVWQVGYTKKELRSKYFLKRYVLSSSQIDSNIFVSDKKIYKSRITTKFNKIFLLGTKRKIHAVRSNWRPSSCTSYLHLRYIQEIHLQDWTQINWNPSTKSTTSKTYFDR